MKFFKAKIKYARIKLPVTMIWTGFLLFLIMGLEPVIGNASAPTLSVFPTQDRPASGQRLPMGNEANPNLSTIPTWPTPISYSDDSFPQVEVTIVLDDLNQPVVTIKADHIETDQTTQLNHFIGRVFIARGPETMTADRAIWNDGTNTIELSGNITMTNPDFKIIAERAIINLDLNLAKIYGGQAYFPAQNYYLSGTLIERTGSNTMYIKDGTVTTCDGPNPPWTIHANELTVTEGGYAKATGVTFDTGVMPIAYMPWFMFPVKNERQSGLLFPMVSNSSRDGFTASLPAFWATGENHDLTYTPVWRSKRGLANTLEGRYHLEEGRGIWTYTYLKDRKHKLYGYNNAPGLKKTGDRYWLRTQNQWRLGEWDINLNLDLASDPFYLSEFNGDIDGFGQSSLLFKQEFGNTMNEYLDPRRSNDLYAQKTDYDTLIRAGLDYTDDLYSHNNKDTVQRLPSVRYAMVGRPVGLSNDSSGQSQNVPRFSMDMQYDYFYRGIDEDSLLDETGHRMVLAPSLEWNKSLGDVATFQLDGNIDMSFYAAKGHRGPIDYTLPENKREKHDNFNSSFGGSLTSSLSTTFNRTFAGGPGKATAFRHQMIPTASFTYTEADDDQYDLPYWDFLDRKLSRKTLRYGLQNVLVSKTPTFDKSGSATGHDYFQFLKVGLWGSYDFTDNLDWKRNPDIRNLTPEHYEKGAGPLEVDVEAFFDPVFSMRLISTIDGHDGDVSSHDISARVELPRGDSFGIAYDFDTIDSGTLASGYTEYEEIRSNLGLVLTSNLRADFSSRYDMRAGQSLTTNALLMYQAQCYEIGLLLTKSSNDNNVALVVDLLGLGTDSNSFGNMATSPAFFD